MGYHLLWSSFWAGKRSRFWDRILVQSVPDSMAHALMALQDGLRFVPHSILQTRHMYVVFSQVGYMYECCC